MIDRPKLPPVRKHAIYSDDPIFDEIRSWVRELELQSQKAVQDLHDRITEVELRLNEIRDAVQSPKDLDQADYE